MRFYRKITDTLENAIDSALNDLSEDSIIKPFLIASRSEVKRMCITEYDEERTFAEKREEGVEKGIFQILSELVKDGILL